jgi:nitroreductase
MEFPELIFNRRSVRGYMSRPIPKDVLERVLDSLRIAPSAANLQPCRFVVIQDAGLRAKLKDTYNKNWFANAPVIVAGCVDPAKAWKRSDGFNSAELDMGIAFDHLTLAAANEGLGTCWVCNFDESTAKKILGIPDNIRLVALMPLGYPDPAVPQRPFTRKFLEEILKWDKWQ